MTKVVLKTAKSVCRKCDGENRRRGLSYRRLLLAIGLGIGIILATTVRGTTAFAADDRKAVAASDTESQTAAKRKDATERDGQHDFDFQIGTWKTHVKRLMRPLTGSATWAEYEGITVVRKLWNGRANLSELEADGPAGHLENLSLRLYNPESHQWSLNYANSRGGTIDLPPTIGEFKNRRGEFYDMELINGRNVLVRNIWSDITANSCRFEQAFSEDAGKTWEPNWVAVNTRVSDHSAPALAQTNSGGAKTGSRETSEDRYGQHDFDWDIGTWKIHVKRLQHPLTGSTAWVEYNGTDVVRKVWDGRANLGEVEWDGPAGHLELLTLRLYNPQAHQWNIYFANNATGTLSPSAVGEFTNGRGEFYDQETYNGRSILIRFGVSDITPNSCRFEQAFSTDGGKTWEVNLIVTETLVKDDAVMGDGLAITRMGPPHRG